MKRFSLNGHWQGECFDSNGTKFGTYYLGNRPQATDMAVVIRSAK